MKGYNQDTGLPTALYDFCHTIRQRKLQNAADLLLYKAGFYQTDDQEDLYEILDADCISAFGLRPTWHGTV